MRTSFYLVGSILLIVMALGTGGCKKHSTTSTGHLNFSTDTLVFDTVFTTIGSTTKSFKIYNPESKILQIESIELMGGENSPYRINVDGVSGFSHSDIALEGKDSLFIFVEVTLDPNNLTTPMVIEDSIRFRTNGSDQYVVLAAWGRDAYFHYNDTNSGTWPNDKPHVVYGYAGIDSGQSLTIQAGTEIYLHKKSYIFVYESELHIEGEINNEVVIQGDRLESDYDNVSGQFHGIYFYKALPSTINYTIIKNGTAGIHVDGEDPGNASTPTVQLTNTIVQNCASYGLWIIRGGHIAGFNNIIAKNGYYSLFILGGGDFDFTNCHFVGYGEGQQPTIAFNNYFYNAATEEFYSEPIVGKIDNSVIYGTEDQEIVIDTLANSGLVVDIEFRGNLIRSETLPNVSDPFYSTLYANIFNQDPLFTDIELYDFTFPVGSPMNNNGRDALKSAFGINGTLRGPTPDIGAYENP